MDGEGWRLRSMSRTVPKGSALFDVDIHAEQTQGEAFMWATMRRTAC